jgi:peroxiredoxin
VFDIDFWNHDNIVQYNYAHDSEGYCVAVFGADSGATTNSTVRYNLCVNNGLSPRMARQGAIWVNTWNGGTLEGLQIYNNTIYWNPPTNAPALHVDARFRGGNLFANNLIFSTQLALVSTKQPVRLQNNVYWYSGTGNATWEYAGAVFESFDVYRKRAGQDRNGMFADPLFLSRSPGSSSPSANPFSIASNSPVRGAALDLKDMGGRDVLGRPLASGGIDVGAFQFREPGLVNKRTKAREAPSFQLNTVLNEKRNLHDSRGNYVLISFLGMAGSHSTDSRSQIVILKSMVNQYRTKGLEILAIALPDGDTRGERLSSVAYDWNLDHIPLLLDSDGLTAAAYGVKSGPATFLIDRQGRIASIWNGYASAIEIGLTLRALLGPPPGGAPIELIARGRL